MGEHRSVGGGDKAPEHQGHVRPPDGFLGVDERESLRRTPPRSDGWRRLKAPRPHRPLGSHFRAGALEVYGAFMEPSGRNRWQPLATGAAPETAQIGENRCMKLRASCEHLA